MKTKAEHYFKKGIEFGTAGEHQKAIDCFSRVIELKADYSPAYISRGLAYFGLQKYNETIDDCAKAIELNPNRGDAYGIRAKLIQNCNNITKQLMIILKQ